MRSIDQDVRSQIYSIATKKNLAIPRGDGTQGKPANAHPSYGDSSSSNDIVEQGGLKVNPQFSLSNAENVKAAERKKQEQTDTDSPFPVSWEIRGKDVALEELEANPDNIELEIIKRQSEDSANWKKHPSTTDELPFNNSIRNTGEDVNNQNSLSAKEQTDTDSPFPVPWEIRGEDVALEEAFPLPEGYRSGRVALPQTQQTPMDIRLRMC